MGHVAVEAIDEILRQSGGGESFFHASRDPSHLGAGSLDEGLCAAAAPAAAGGVRVTDGLEPLEPPLQARAAEQAAAPAPSSWWPRSASAAHR